MSPTPPSRPLPARLRIAAAAALVPALTISALLFSPAVAQAADGGVTDDGTVAVAATDADPSAVGAVGTGISLESKADASTTAAFGPVTFAPTTIGTFRIQDTQGGGCLTPPAEDGMAIDHFVSTRACDGAGSQYQDWALVPASTTPNANANTSADEHYFYLLAPSQSMGDHVFRTCLERDTTLFIGALVTAPCDTSKDNQKFRVKNDTPDPRGFALEWQNALNLAITYATSKCATTATDCSVSPSTGAYAGQWFRSDDPNISTLGTLSKQAMGCGVPTSGSAKLQNVTENPMTLTVSTNQSLTNTVSVANTYAVTVGGEASFGVKDIWGVKLAGSFTYNNQTVTTNSSTQSVSDSKSSTVQPTRWIMGTWIQQTYTLAGTWRLGQTIPATPAGGLTWTIPASSSHPVSVNGSPYATYAAVTSHFEKDCTAGPSSTIGTGATDKPAPTLDPTKCGTAISAGQTAAVGTVVTACTGRWNIPTGQGSSDPHYVYQWYLKAGGQGAFTPIPSATDSTFTVDQATLGATPLFLGVSVQELGNAQRLDSDEVISAITVTLPKAATVGGAEAEGTPSAVGGSTDPAAAAAAAAAAGAGAGGAGHRSTLAATGADTSGSLSGVLSAAGLLAAGALVLIRRRRTAR